MVTNVEEPEGSPTPDEQQAQPLERPNSSSNASSVHENDEVQETTVNDNTIYEEDEEEEEELKVNEREPLPFEAEVQDLKRKLEAVVVRTPDLKVIKPVDRDTLPVSYKTNNEKEMKLLQFAENYRVQLRHLRTATSKIGTRNIERPLPLLWAKNECLIDKFVSTYIRPSLLQFTSLYTWQGCAEFVADYLDVDVLEPSHQLPKIIYSPNSVLRRQSGNCFEYSTLLCSLLIGVGYDAYVVSGYATREICFNDHKREDVISSEEEKTQKKQEKSSKQGKYHVNVLKEFVSEYEYRMKQREEREMQEMEKQQKQLEETRRKEREKPLSDPLSGFRIHSWVLVLPGSREVPEPFFIEPFSGESHSAKSECFLGIESVWNHKNYWTYMPYLDNGLAGVNWDLNDSNSWEFILPTTEFIERKRLANAKVRRDDEEIDPEEELAAAQEFRGCIDMPRSWCEPIYITPGDFNTRCPNGKKTVYFNRIKAEKFAEYLSSDGLVARICHYQDFEMSKLIKIEEKYKHRKDKLDTKMTDYRTNNIVEYFGPGRKRHLKEYHYKLNSFAPERKMFFYHEARVDGLFAREETTTSMTELYKDRDDFLIRRHVVFLKKEKKFGPQDPTNQRPIVSITDTFSRNDAKRADDDIQERSYFLTEDRIFVRYHRDDRRITQSWREFHRPPGWEDSPSSFAMSSEMHRAFNADANAAPLKNVAIYQMLNEFLVQEDKHRVGIRAAEQETKDILNDRDMESSNPKLAISFYDVERNEEFRVMRIREEEEKKTEEIRRKELESDYLAPYIARLRLDPAHLDVHSALRLRDQCLQDFKDRMLGQANLIQKRYEEVASELQKKQQWYQQNQTTLTKEQEEDYLIYCSDAMFRIHILETRLQRHKELAPIKYTSLEAKLRHDPRLYRFLTNV